MHLALGNRLGQYKVRERFVAGGRGEVYRALDTLLNREVTRKLLPDAFGDGAD